MKLKNLVAGAAIVAMGMSFSNLTSATPINLVKNGGFEVNTGTGQIGSNTTIEHWSSGGYNFLFANGTADSDGAMSGWYNAPLHLWGANNGGAHALASSKNGGYMVGADGAYGVAPVEQLIEGLTPGKKYELNFEWAAAQQAGYDGATTEWWTVYFGNEVQATNIYSNASHASSDWMDYSMIFTASSTSAMLSFLAAGTPDGLPPFSLLDGVSLIEVQEGGAVPEPASWLLFGAAVGMAGLSARRRRA